ncbi:MULTISPECIES: ribonuclease HIII [Salimicrobium]|uniref:Ribonuclease HIII n=2 Tax=Salimicrobium TaxID=351195 RepID=A0ABY1KMP8_9BACI|nr:MULTISPECIES: ribonuclease HIII [Salimicrobium]SDX60444.1 ribonuclease HIII [Salimicrobium album]SIS50040.1 ribonuclease HIII [Salimicrobium salexigens]
MPTYVLKTTPERIEEMKNYYSRYLKKTPPYAVFQAHTSLASITAYQSGKVVFQGKTPEQEAGQWEKGVHMPEERNPKKETHAYHPPSGLFHSPHIGSDEAGTGDYFGPITVCALYADEEQIRTLKEIGVKDSKHLTDDKITVIAKRIVEMNISYRLMRLSNDRYNEWREKGWSQGKMKALLHHQAVTKLGEDLSPIHPEGILIDEFARPEIYKKHLRSAGKTIENNTYFMTKAESYSIPVAAASILARSLFVKEMNKLSHHFGRTIPKGASSKVDRAAAAILKTHGEDTLKHVVKWHFANTAKAKKIAQEG